MSHSLANGRLNCRKLSLMKEPMDEIPQNPMPGAPRLTRLGRLLEPAPAATDDASRVDALPGVRQGAGPGEFIDGSYRLASRSLEYMLYLPSGPGNANVPLVVMLHGCSQGPGDFAAGTGMNQLAREQGFMVLYPAQSPAANQSRCWNWFENGHQQRDSGEPALIAGLTKDIIDRYGIDSRRVYIAGLSAGGAMATIVAESYPEIFAAVGVHSGLPRGAASSMMEAISVMRAGRATPAAINRHARAVPTIVFHGDQDRTVHPRNGEQVMSAVLSRMDSGSAVEITHGIRGSVEQGIAGGGRRYTRTTFRNGGAGIVAEHWLVHGAGHAWSGGQADGTCSDTDGPDATRAMLRFFLAQRNGIDGAATNDADFAA